MNKEQALEHLISTQNIQIPILNFSINLVLAAAMGFVLGLAYVRWGESLSNRYSFAKNFPMMAVTTFIIITIVKSSLALSLGLVGALSIVRFRTAIKEPEELSYLFFSIAIGLGLGADQRILVLVGLAFVLLMQFAKSKKRKEGDNKNLILAVSSNNQNHPSLDEIIGILNSNSVSSSLKRFDESKSALDASFVLEFSDFDSLNKCKNELLAKDSELTVSFMDNKGLV